MCDVGLATNRQWKTETGELKEDTEFHRIVLWGKLAEVASQYLKKGERAYFQGRLATRTWTAQDGTQRSTTKIIAEDMMLLASVSARTPRDAQEQAPKPSTKAQPEDTRTERQRGLDVEPDDVPF